MIVIGYLEHDKKIIIRFTEKKLVIHLCLINILYTNCIISHQTLREKIENK